MPELKITIPSCRFYMDTVEKRQPGITGSVMDTFTRFNILTEWSYNRIYDNRVLGAPAVGTLTSLIKQEGKERFGYPVSDYYVASIYSTASGILSSQLQLQKQYEEEFLARQENRRRKVADTQEELDKKLAIKSLLVQFSKARRDGLWFDTSVFKTEYGLAVDTDSVLFRGKKNKWVKLPLYGYECMLDRQVKRCKSRIALINEKIRRADAIHRDKPARAVFGSKKQYRMKDTMHMTKAQMDQWHRERDFRRFHVIHFSGRHTSKYGNYQCRYDAERNLAEITLMDGKILELEGITFPYRGDELRKVRMDKEHPAIGYSLERHTDGHGREYLVLKATFTVRNDRVNDYTGDGCISIDLNYDHVAWAELNGEGCRIDGGVIPFCLTGLSSAEAESLLGSILKKVIRICVERKKPLSMEDLKIKIRGTEYGDANANRKLSSFACATMTALLEGQALRNSVGIIKVNPAYTSFLGKVKYMKQYGISIHCAAAYVIGRRAMGLDEKLPPSLKTLYYKKDKSGKIQHCNAKPFAAYRYAYKKIKKIPTAFWYTDIRPRSWADLDNLAGKYIEALKLPDTGKPASICAA